MLDSGPGVTASPSDLYRYRELGAGIPPAVSPERGRGVERSDLDHLLHEDADLGPLLYLVGQEADLAALY